jgi:hypothetical protein
VAGSSTKVASSGSWLAATRSGQHHREAGLQAQELTARGLVRGEQPFRQRGEPGAAALLERHQRAAGGLGLREQHVPGRAVRDAKVRRGRAQRRAPGDFAQQRYQARVEPDPVLARPPPADLGHQPHRYAIFCIIG